MATGLIYDAQNKLVNPAVPGLAPIQPLPPVTTAAPLPTATPAPLIQPAMQNVGAVTAPTATPRTITADETVAGQLNTLLSKESPFIQSARNRGMEVANSRGLINSSIAAGTSERAAIDAAMPIAQQDSTVNANAGQSAQQSNQDISLTGYKAGIDSAQQAENFGYRTRENEQNIAANTALQNDRIALDLKRMDATSRDQYNAAASPIIQQTQSEIAQIQRTADSVLSPEAKVAAIGDLTQRQNANLQTIATLYGYKLDWNTPDSTTVPSGWGTANGVVKPPPPSVPTTPVENNNSPGW